MKFEPTEVSVDAEYNVTVNGIYKEDDGTVVSDEKAYQFDPLKMPTKKSEFLQEVERQIEVRQPVLSAEEQEKRNRAETAKALLDGFVGKDVNLASPQVVEAEPEV